MVDSMTSFSSLRIGVLALQGAFAKHESAISALGATAVQVRTPEELQKCDGLIIPGGESSAIFKQMQFIKLIDPLLVFASTKPIFGTCAGMILMSKEIIGGPPTVPLGLVDIVVERNAYGRQVDSFSTELEINLANKKKNISVFFIRAPRVKSCGPDVNVLANYMEEPVLMQQGHHLVASFHSELTSDVSLHEYFLSLVLASKKK
jgi:5'-phosphate synthase pdxT subunit